MTYMQKIDASAMMRELTEHETTQVSGGFGNEINIVVPESAIPAGFTEDDLVRAEYSLDVNTNELTTYLYFSTIDINDTRSTDIIGDVGEYGSPRVQGSATITRDAGNFSITGSASVDLKIKGKGFGFELSGTYNSPRQRYEITIPLDPPRPATGGGGNRNGGSAPPTRRK
jgi:hypothetical protein